MTSQAPPTQPVQQRADASTNLVLEVLKLVKSCQLYGDSNQAVRQRLEPAREAIATFCASWEVDTARILFSNDVILVNRRVLRASRDKIVLACELGELLAHCGLSEITFDLHVRAREVLAFARLLADGQRDQLAAAKLRESSLHGIQVRYTELSPEDWNPEFDRSLFARVVRDYAASTLFMCRFYDELASGDLQMGNRVKRVAQKLVAISEEAPQLTVALAAARFPNAEIGRVAVSTALIACGMARLLTSDRRALVNLVVAALMAEVGPARFADTPPDDRVAASALVLLSAAGQLHPTTVARSVIVFEAVEPHERTPSSVLGKTLHMARAFNAIRVPVRGQRTPNMNDVVARLNAMYGSADDRPFLQLLTGALGFFPIGSIVELDSGEVAAIMGVPSLAVDYQRPPVRLLCDSSGGFLAHPKDIDLARPARGEKPRVIKRLLGTMDALRASN